MTWKKLKAGSDAGKSSSMKSKRGYGGNWQIVALAWFIQQES
jgi:hypothetical protein